MTLTKQSSRPLAATADFCVILSFKPLSSPLGIMLGQTFLGESNNRIERGGIPIFGEGSISATFGHFAKHKNLRFEDHTFLFPSLLTVEDFGKISAHRVGSFSTLSRMSLFV